jgi:serine/threonine protein kinase
MFGPYDILETIGQGGMGLVYRATDTSLDRIVALKVLRDDLRTNQHVVARFQREAEAFASLNHPNIVHIFSVGKVGLIPYIAMEFIDGVPLSTLMKRERRLPWERALSILVQVAEALDCAHASHIIHRDIKPGNVLVSKDDHAYVTDFGIAKVLTANTQLTIDGSRLGTPQYMSPERCLNKEVTASSDLYSLGVLAFQLITGRLPYESEDAVELIRMIIKEPPNRISNFISDVPKDVERLIAYLLEKDPKKRPPSANEWAHLTRRVLDGKPLFDNESAFTDSLQEIRDSVATPTPFDSEKPKKKTISIRKYWNALPRNVKYILVSLLVLFCGYQTGSIYRILTTADTLYSMQSYSETDVSAWYRSSELVAVSNESLGVSVLTINAGEELDIEPYWLGGDSLLVQFLNAAQENKQVLVDLVTGSGSELPGPGRGQERILASIESQGYWVERQSKDLKTASISFVAADSQPSIEIEIEMDSSSQKIDGLYPIEGTNDFLFSLADESRSGELSIQLYDFENQESNLLTQGKQFSFGFQNSEGLWFAEEITPDANSLWFRNSENDHDVELITSTKAIDVQHFTADYELCVVVQTSDNKSLGDIVLFRSRTGEQIASMGKAFQAIWHPSGKYILATAPDRQNTTQIWAIQGEKPFNRLQLTYLEMGTEEGLWVNADGSRVVGRIQSPGSSKLVVVDVKQESLQDQGL